MCPLNLKIVLAFKQQCICEDEIFLSFFIKFIHKYGSVFELAILFHWLSVIPVSKPSYIIIASQFYLFIYSSSGSSLLHVGFH